MRWLLNDGCGVELCYGEKVLGTVAVLELVMVLATGLMGFFLFDPVDYDERGKEKKDLGVSYWDWNLNLVSPSTFSPPSIPFTAPRSLHHSAAPLRPKPGDE